jgi:hypothetical protein
MANQTWQVGSDTVKDIEANAVCYIDYECDTLDGEAGQIRGFWTGEIDGWGKMTIISVEGERRKHYLFPREIVDFYPCDPPDNVKLRVAKKRLPGMTFEMLEFYAKALGVRLESTPKNTMFPFSLIRGEGKDSMNEKLKDFNEIIAELCKRHAENEVYGKIDFGSFMMTRTWAYLSIMDVRHFGIVHEQFINELVGQMDGGLYLGYYFEGAERVVILSQKLAIRVNLDKMVEDEDACVVKTTSIHQ